MATIPVDANVFVVSCGRVLLELLATLPPITTGDTVLFHLYPKAFEKCAQIWTKSMQSTDRIQDRDAYLNLSINEQVKKKCFDFPLNFS